MKKIKLIITVFSLVFVCNISNANNLSINVDCQEYALDMMDLMEKHFGCFDDAATYNEVSSQIEELCEAMDQ